jgi:hypothetical protein
VVALLDGGFVLDRPLLPGAFVLLRPWPVGLNADVDNRLTVAVAPLDLAAVGGIERYAEAVAKMGCAAPVEIFADLFFAYCVKVACFDLLIA